MRVERVWLGSIALAERIELDLTAHVPIYRQIVDQIRGRIEAGEWQEGDQLPTVRQLAEALQVNFNTVARAYRLLDHSGWVSTQHGRGSFVRGPDGRQLAEPASLRQLTRAFADQARRLGFAPEAVAREVGYVLEQWAQEERQ